jgi:hypothetical protein
MSNNRLLRLCRNAIWCRLLFSTLLARANIPPLVQQYQADIGGWDYGGRWSCCRDEYGMFLYYILLPWDWLSVGQIVVFTGAAYITGVSADQAQEYILYFSRPPMGALSRPLPSCVVEMCFFQSTVLGLSTLLTLYFFGSDLYSPSFRESLTPCVTFLADDDHTGRF